MTLSCTKGGNRNLKERITTKISKILRKKMKRKEELERKDKKMESIEQ